MITRITGIVRQVSATAVLMEIGPLWVELLTPTCGVEKLRERVGVELTLHTVLHLDGDPARGTLAPRLFGFASEPEREFWQLLTTVKGIGARKALRAMARPSAEIAAMIVAGDEKLLATLPEIGRRTAQQMIAELREKADAFAAGAELPPAAPGDAEAEALNAAAQEALAVLVQLGERRTEAAALLQRVLAVSEKGETAERLIQHAYRIKAGGG